MGFFPPPFFFSVFGKGLQGNKVLFSGFSGGRGREAWARRAGGGGGIVCLGCFAFWAFRGWAGGGKNSGRPARRRGRGGKKKYEEEKGKQSLAGDELGGVLGGGRGIAYFPGAGENPMGMGVGRAWMDSLPPKRGGWPPGGDLWNLEFLPRRAQFFPTGRCCLPPSDYGSGG